MKLTTVLDDRVCDCVFNYAYSAVVVSKKSKKKRKKVMLNTELEQRMCKAAWRH
jgi:uncharacterized protein (DUF4213/DUF364 family)